VFELIVVVPAAYVVEVERGTDVDPETEVDRGADVVCEKATDAGCLAEAFPFVGDGLYIASCTQ
jgi:hypothetical protein